MKKNGTAIVTGASRGIGAAIAAGLAEDGYALALSCRNKMDQLEKLADRLQKEYHVKIHIYRLDVRDTDAIREMTEDVLTWSEHIDVLINNAGVAYYGLLSDMEEKEWDEVMDTNLKSCFSTAKAVIPTMVRQKSGSIINISSVWGSCGASCEVAYSASKGGMNAFTKALAKELAPSGIAVNAISCGVIDTEMNGHLSKEEKEALREEIPADRFGIPKDVADTVRGLLQMSYVTGQIIGCDGGY